LAAHGAGGGVGVGIGDSGEIAWQPLRKYDAWVCDKAGFEQEHFDIEEPI
jgi:hypothetical protein